MGESLAQEARVSERKDARKKRNDRKVRAQRDKRKQSLPFARDGSERVAARLRGVVIVRVVLGRIRDIRHVARQVVADVRSRRMRQNNARGAATPLHGVEARMQARVLVHHAVKVALILRDELTVRVPLLHERHHHRTGSLRTHVRREHHIQRLTQKRESDAAAAPRHAHFYARPATRPTCIDTTPEGKVTK